MGQLRWNAKEKTLEEQNAAGEWETVAMAVVKGKPYSWDLAKIEIDTKFRRELIKRWNAAEPKGAA